MYLRPTTKLRAAKTEAREQHIKLLRKLGWIPDGAHHWKNPRGRGISYTTADAISLLKLRGELKRRGHSWKI